MVVRPAVRRSRPEAPRAVLDALHLVRLDDVSDRMASTYSGGMIRRLELAQALVNRPRVMVMDEPTIGVDPIARRAVWNRVLEFRRELGMTILVTTHYMDEAEELCDRVGLMHLGRLRALGSPAELKAGLGETSTMDDVSRAYAGDGRDEDGGTYRDVRNTRRTAGRMG